MKKKGMSAAAVVFVIIYLFCVGAVGYSFLSSDFLGEFVSVVTGKVILNGGSFPKGSESIRVPLNKGETVKLSGFTALKSADLSGSEDHEEVAAWAEKNPQVDVTYTVTLPDGRSVSSKSESVDLSAVNANTFPLYSALLKYLPNAKVAELGSSQSDAPLTPENIASLQSEYPALDISYTVVLGGKPVNLTDSSVDLRALRAENAADAAAWLGCMKHLGEVNFGDESSSELSMADIVKLSAACPGAHLNYSFSLYGYPIDLGAEELNLSHVPVDDNGEAVISALRCMKNCKKLDMDFCGVDDLRMEEIRDMFPDVEVIWRIWFGDVYSVRTDTERILASRPSVGGMLDNTVGEKLKYCTKVKYLDLGHNDDLTDISFVNYMPDLEVFIIAINTHITDISPLRNCPKLEYLEINSTPVSDISCLAGMKTLHHLNIACTQVRDISALYDCTELERLWIGLYTEVPQEQVLKMHEIAPNCVIDLTTDDPHGNQWRWDYYDESMFVYHYVPRYDLLRKQLGYTYSEYSYYWKDPLCGLPCPPQYVGTSPDGIIEKPQDAE